MEIIKKKKKRFWNIYYTFIVHLSFYYFYYWFNYWFNIIINYNNKLVNIIPVFGILKEYLKKSCWLHRILKNSLIIN